MTSDQFPRCVARQASLPQGLKASRVLRSDLLELRMEARRVMACCQTVVSRDLPVRASKIQEETAHVAGETETGGQSARAGTGARDAESKYFDGEDA